MYNRSKEKFGMGRGFLGRSYGSFGGQKRDLSSLTDCKGGTILLTANGGGELKILQSLMRGSSKSFHNTTKSPKLSRNIEKKNASKNLLYWLRHTFFFRRYQMFGSV